jgi:hypothetical protein
VKTSDDDAHLGQLSRLGLVVDVFAIPDNMARSSNASPQIFSQGIPPQEQPKAEDRLAHMAPAGSSIGTPPRFYLAVHAEEGKHEADCDGTVSPCVRSGEAEEKLKNKISPSGMEKTLERVFFGCDAFSKAMIILRMRLPQTRRMRHREFKFNRKGSTV